MKRIFAILLAFIMILAVLSGCNKSQNDDNSQNSDISQNSGTSSSAVDSQADESLQQQNSSQADDNSQQQDNSQAEDNSQVDESSQQQENSQDDDNSQDDNASQNPSENEGEQNPSGKRLSVTLTIAETLPSCLAFEDKDGKPYCFYAYDTEGHLYRVLWNDFTGLNEKDVVVVDHNDDIKKVDEVNPPGGWSAKYEVTAIEVSGVSASCISKNEDGAYILTLPNSGETIKLQNEQILYVPYITDELVETAENKINEAVSAYSNSSDFYLQINDGYLCLFVEVIKHLDPSSSQETEGEVVGGGCGIDHEHLFFSERISTQALEIGSSENPQKFKLSITGDYADNILTELEDSYLAGETITFQLETITEHYYVVTMNGITLPQAESSLEYTWFGFRMPEEDVVISITQKAVDIPPPPADSDDITFQCRDILSKVLLNEEQKKNVQELLADNHDWIDQMPEIVVNCLFTGWTVNAGYCSNSGILVDYSGNRSRQLNDEEKAFVESLISMLEGPSDTNNATEFSYADELAMFPEGTPGVKKTGFRNTTELLVHNDVEAIGRAMNECTIEWSATEVYYDATKEIWKVTFYTKGVPGGDQSVYLGANGITLMIVYGE